MSPAHILVVDDERDIRELLKEILVDEGYEVSVAENGETARLARRARRPDLVLLDIWMPDVDGISLLKEWNDERGPSAPVIMMSGHGTVESAVEPPGRSVAMQQLREQMQRVAQRDVWVLIHGEPGTGKELCARYLHALSARRDRAFVSVGVATLLRENSAVELFGAEEGDRVHYGLLEQANGGTLFLDDVGEMDLAVQARLYGALASGACLRVGGSEPVQLDVRVVAATHRDLAQEVQAKRFREDLYYQLAVVPLTVPPLREHAEDVPDLLNQALDRFVAQEGLPYRRFTVAAQNRLRHYTKPGNIRELQNLVQRLLILGTGSAIEAAEVEAALAAGRDGPLAPPGLFDLPLREARENFERAYLEYQLRQVGGSIGKVAKQAGMERTHLYRKLRALGMNLKEAKPEEEGE